MMATNKPRQSLILCWMLLLGAERFSCVVGLNHEVETSVVTAAHMKDDTADSHDAPPLDDIASTTKAEEKGNSFLRQEQPKRSLFGNSLKQNFQTAKAKMAQKFKQDYGEDYYNEFFMTDWANGTARVTQGRRFFVSPSVEKSRIATHENEGPSWNRMVRRLALKILQAQNNKKSEKVTFIWATGKYRSRRLTAVASSFCLILFRSLTCLNFFPSSCFVRIF
jgi:hypothetical protein